MTFVTYVVWLRKSTFLKVIYDSQNRQRDKKFKLIFYSCIYIYIYSVYFLFAMPSCLHCKEINDMLKDIIKVFSFCSSSGLTINGAVSLTSSSRAVTVPQGEQQLNDVALNKNGTILYTAAGDRVRVWDLRR